MIEEGCLKGVNEIYGMHNYPLCNYEEVHIIEGPVMAEES